MKLRVKVPCPKQLIHSPRKKTSTNAERCQKYRDKLLRENPEARAQRQYKALQMQDYRKKMSREQKLEAAELSKFRMRLHRKRKKEKEEEEKKSQAAANVHAEDEPHVLRKKKRKSRGRRRQRRKGNTEPICIPRKKEE